MSGSHNVGNDVRFLNTECWIWSPEPYDNIQSRNTMADCIDGETGLKITNSSFFASSISSSSFPTTSSSEAKNDEVIDNVINYSSQCTYSFTKNFLHLLQTMKHVKFNVLQNALNSAGMEKDSKDTTESIERSGGGEFNLTLKSLRTMKSVVSPEYENVKDLLLHKNAVFRHWQRRSMR